nr:helix-turn-helix domain-containing protein [Serratia marcescens]
MQIGEKIKRIRTTFNLTQDELGQDLHLTRQTISNWEKGKSYPSIQDIVTISDRYHVSLDELLKEDQEMLAHFESVDRQSVR